MRYVQSMYYRGWSMGYRAGQNIGASQTLTIQVPLYTAVTAPISSVHDILHLDLFLFMESNAPLRVSYGSIFEDLYNPRGVVHLTIPGPQLPPSIVSMFSNWSTSLTYMLSINITNLSPWNGRFYVPHYEALVDYHSSGVPNPCYHGSSPEPRAYTAPGDALWTTRFVYRGSRSAFPFLALSQCIAHALAVSKRAMILPPIRNYGDRSGVGMEFIFLVWAVGRINRVLGLDGAIGGWR